MIVVFHDTITNFCQYHRLKPLTERAFPNLQDWRIKHLAVKLPPDVVGEQRSVEDEADPVTTQQ